MYSSLKENKNRKQEGIINCVVIRKQREGLKGDVIMFLYQEKMSRINI